MTLVSRVLGFARDVIIARFFGAGVGTDAFFVAFKIPNFLRRLFAEGAFSQAFVPVLSEYKETRSREALLDLINHVAGTLGWILLLVSSIGVAAAPLLIMLFAPGFWDEPERYHLAVDMLRWTFPYLFFIALTAFAGGILNSFNQFAVPAFTPVLLNLSLIGAALWLSPYFDPPVMALAWGVAVAGLSQLLFQIPFLFRMGLLPRPRFKWRHPGVSKILKLMIPAIIGSSVAQINLLLDTVIASFLIAGSVSWLYYADRMVEFPLGVFGIALATVILPGLSRHHANQSVEQFNKTLDWALRLVIVIALPATAGLFFLAGPIMTTLFQYGEFLQYDSKMASLSLMAYSLGLPAFILVKVLAPGYFSRQDTKTPVRFGIIAMVSNMVLNILFVTPMLLWNVTGPHVGLAAATTVSAYINAALLYRGLRHRQVYRPLPGWRRLGIQILLGNLILAAVLFYLVPGLSQWSDWLALDRVLHLLGYIGISIVVYAGVLMLAGLYPRHLRHG